MVCEAYHSENQRTLQKVIEGLSIIKIIEPYIRALDSKVALKGFYKIPTKSNESHKTFKEISNITILEVKP